MKKLTVREVQHNLKAVLDEVEQGREIAVTRRGKVVARILPPLAAPGQVEWPDFSLRMFELLPEGVPGEPPSRLIESSREERF